MNWAAFGNSQQLGALLVSELTVELHLTVNLVQLAGPRFTARAVLGVDAPMAQRTVVWRNRQPLRSAYIAYRDGGAGTKSG